MYKNALFLVIILTATSCAKTSIKPQKPNTDTTKTPSQPVDTSKAGGTGATLPTGVFTTFGSSGAAWITAMQSTSQSIEPEKIYPNKIAKDSQGNVFILFNFYGTLDVDPSSNVLLSTGNTNDFAMLIKYSASGKLLWYKVFNTSGETYGMSVITDGFDNVYCSIKCDNASTLQFGADSYSTHVANNTVIIKFSPSGALGWLREAAGSNVANIVADPAGNIYIVGTLLNDFTFYGTGQTDVNVANTTSAESYYWTKYNNNGQYVLTKFVTQSATDLNATLVNPIIAVDQSQNVYVAGRTATNGYSLNFPSIVGDNTAEGGGFIAKYDNNGNPLWFSGYTGGHSIANISAFSAIKADLNGNLYLFGINHDVISDLLWKMDSQGNPLWSKTVATGLNNGFSDLCVDSENNVFVSGDYAPIPSQPSGGGFNHAIFFNKYGTDGGAIYAKNLLGYSAVSYIAFYDALIDNQGNIDVLGYFSGSIKLLGTAGDPNNPWSDLNISMFIAHFPEQQ